MIKIEYSYTSEYGVFNDAIILPEDQSFTDAEIEALKQARIDAWLAALNQPPIEEPV